MQGVSHQLKAEGRRNTRFAPFGFKWREAGPAHVPGPGAGRAGALHQGGGAAARGYSWHQIRRYFAYEWKVRNRVGNQFGYTEIRELDFGPFKEFVMGR